MVEAIKKLFCPECGQKLALPTTDLRQRFRCPRCHTVHFAADLVPLQRTVDAVPMDASLETALRAEQVLANPEPPTHDESPPDTLPMPNTARMPGAPPRPLHMMAPAHGASPSPAAPTAWNAAPAAAAMPIGIPPEPLLREPAPVPLVPQSPGVPHQPPPPPWVDGRSQGPGVITRAVAGAAAGASAIGWLTSRVLRAAGWLDRLLAGYRAIAIGIVSFVVITAPLMDAILGTEWLAAASIVVFVLALCIFAVARIDAFRDESGWSLSLAASALVEPWVSLWGWALRAFGAPPGQRAIEWSKAAFLVGVVVPATTNALELLGVDADSLQSTRYAAFGVFLLGVALWAAGRRRLREAARSAGHEITVTSAPAMALAITNLPLLLDCRDPASVLEAAQHCGDRVVADVLRVLARWTQRRSLPSERRYQQKLHDLLLMAMPETNPRREKYIGEQERPDLLLGGPDAGVVIEMKAYATTSTINDLIGKAARYLVAWRGRGPVLLVLCRTDPSAGRLLEPHLLQFRQQGYPILAVLAAA